MGLMGLPSTTNNTAINNVYENCLSGVCIKNEVYMIRSINFSIII